MMDEPRIWCIVVPVPVEDWPKHGLYRILAMLTEPFLDWYPSMTATNTPAYMDLPEGAAGAGGGK